MLERLLIRLFSLAFAAIGLVVLNNQVLDGALCIGSQGDTVVITDGCFLRNTVDLPGSGSDVFGGALDPDRTPTSRTPAPHLGR